MKLNFKEAMLENRPPRVRIFKAGPRSPTALLNQSAVLALYPEREIADGANFIALRQTKDGKLIISSLALPRDVVSVTRFKPCGKDGQARIPCGRVSVPDGSTYEVKVVDGGLELVLCK